MVPPAVVSFLDTFVVLVDPTHRSLSRVSSFATYFLPSDLHNKSPLSTRSPPSSSSPRSLFTVFAVRSHLLGLVVFVRSNPFPLPDLSRRVAHFPVGECRSLHSRYFTTLASPVLSPLKNICQRPRVSETPSAFEQVVSGNLEFVMCPHHHSSIHLLRSIHMYHAFIFAINSGHCFETCLARWYRCL